MTSTTSIFVDVADVQLGMYICLEVGWMSHPFAMSRFKVATPAQLQALRTSGVQQVRVDVMRSEPQALAQWRAGVSAPEGEPEMAMSAEPSMAGEADAAAQAPSQTLHAAQCSDSNPSPSAATPDGHLSQPMERFLWAADCYLELCAQVPVEPTEVGERAHALVHGYVQELGHSQGTILRLLAGRASDHAAAHPVNVTILSLLMGKSLGLGERQLYDLGMAALLHDIGKVQLPAPFHTHQPHMQAEDLQRYQSHVGASVAVAQAMGLSPDIQQYIAQHHEFEDGSGYPLGLVEDDLVLPAQVLALINTYDHLCNPSAHMPAYTPHEALSVLFAQRKQHFGQDLVQSLIAVTGIYPPGTVVQLSDGRYGVVCGVAQRNPRKPQVRVHEGPLSMVGNNSTVIDLDEHPGLLIKRSLRTEQLPRDVLQSLSPQRRICYFFERAVDISAQRKTP